MQVLGAMTGTSDWASSGGATWAGRWRDTDRALAELEEALVARLLEEVPVQPFRAFEIGCGAGVTTADLAKARSDATIVACDVSAALLDVARERLAGNANVRFVVGDAAGAAQAERPFGLLYSRHGVMFFPDPPRAFAVLREATAPAGRLIFSCFRDWALNPWASELAAAAAGGEVPPPGRDPGGFAFADPVYVEQILTTAGWSHVECTPVDFTYVPGSGSSAVDHALDFLAEIGPASSVVRNLEPEARPAALERMRETLSSRLTGERVAFTAAAWIWSARAGQPA